MHWGAEKPDFDKRKLIEAAERILKNGGSEEKEDEPLPPGIQVSIALLLGGYLRDKGYILATENGTRIKQLEETRSFGLLVEPTLTPSKLPFVTKIRGLFSRTRFIGVLEFDEKDEYDDWTLKIYGKNNVPRLTMLAQDISTDYKVSAKPRVSSYLEKKEPRWITRFIRSIQ